jgi:hypothetical protein
MDHSSFKRWMCQRDLSVDDRNYDPISSTLGFLSELRRADCFTTRADFRLYTARQIHALDRIVGYDFSEASRIRPRTYCAVQPTDLRNRSALVNWRDGFGARNKQASRASFNRIGNWPGNFEEIVAYRKYFYVTQ